MQRKGGLLGILIIIAILAAVVIFVLPGLTVIVLGGESISNFMEETGSTEAARCEQVKQSLCNEGQTPTRADYDEAYCLTDSEPSVRDPYTC